MSEFEVFLNRHVDNKMENGFECTVCGKEATVVKIYDMEVQETVIWACKSCLCRAIEAIDKAVLEG